MACVGVASRQRYISGCILSRDPLCPPSTEYNKYEPLRFMQRAVAYFYMRNEQLQTVHET